MTVKLGMGWVRSFLKWASRSKVQMDLLRVLCLGAVAYVLFHQAAALTPAEAAILVMAAAALIRAGSRWWGWHRALSLDGSLLDWVQRIRQGERTAMPVPRGLRAQDHQVAVALNTVLEELNGQRSELEELQHAVSRDWRELDALLDAVQRQHETEVGAQIQAGARLANLGRDLKAAIEGTLRLDQVELNYRLRADQSRLQGQAFRATLEQLQAGLEHFENLLEELQDTFPRLRREEDALGRLADAGLRQSARLALSVKGLVAQAPRLVDDSQARTEWLRKLRQSADGVRDQTEALARRIEGFREEAQSRTRSFGGAQGSLKELDHVAQQTGLLAVNAAILAQQDGGTAGMAAIGGRLRFLADQTADGASGMERMLDEHQRALERETAGLWDLQEVTQRLLSEVHEMLRTAGHMDLQGRDLERALETHLGHVDQVRQSSERAELSLHEVSARAMALESAHGRQWSVEAKIVPEHERLTRAGVHLAEVGDELARISQQNIDEIWDILARHQEIRRTDAYRQVTSDGLSRPMGPPHGVDTAWNGLAWARARRHPRLLAGASDTGPPIGRQAPDGGLCLLVLGLDALQCPAPSALESWGCDPSGQEWDLRLLGSLRTESHRLALLALIKESPITPCFPGMDLRITPDGVHLRLPHPYPGLPGFMAGLRLELPLESDLLDHPFREAGPWNPGIQCFVWVGPGQDGGPQNQCLRLLHDWVKDGHDHECFLPWLPRGGQRPPCLWLGESAVEERLPESLPIRCLGLGADPATLHSIRDRLLEVGAHEGPGGAILGAVGMGHAHPEALLLRLFQSEAELAGAFHPDLVPYQVRMREEVLGGATGDPYGAAWCLLEDLQREGWLMPLPSV